MINQKKILMEYLVKSFPGEYEIVDFYVDDGLSGTDDTRENFVRMIRDIELKKINCVICKTLARAFRNYSDQGYYLEYYFQQKNIRFICLGDPAIDTYTHPEVLTGLEVPITGLMNDRFAGRTSSDVRRTLDTKRRNGEFIGAFPPYGYLKNPDNKNQLILDEETALIKKQMMTWIVHEGMSLSGVAKRLNDFGIPNPTSYKKSKGWHYHNPKVKENDGLWVGSTVRRALLSQVNLGHMVQGKQRVVSYKVHDKISVPPEDWFVKKNTHEATFTQEEYDSLVRILGRESKTKADGQPVHLFGGFLRCNDCGKAMQRKSAKKIVYYACRTYTEKSKLQCSKHSIREDAVEKAVLTAIQTQIAMLDAHEEIAAQVRDTSVSDTQPKLAEKTLKDKRKHLDKKKALADGLYADWKSGEISHEQYCRMKKNLAAEIAEISAAISRLEAEEDNRKQSSRQENNALTQFLQNKNIQKLDRDLLLELVDMIYVHQGKEITIVFRWSGGD